MTSVINRFALERIGNENMRKIAFFSNRNSEKKKKKEGRRWTIEKDRYRREESFEDRLERRRDHLKMRL